MRFDCPPVRFPDGRPMFRFPWIPSGRTSTRRLSGGLFATASTRRWRIYSSTWHRRRRRAPKASSVREVQPRRSFTGGFKHCRTPPAQFRLNVELPIPFDGWGHMEVDLLCADARVAIELDGGQHLADAEAYRRHRRKDLLLQENGYFVLRFLAEDVGKRLDAVLDAIVRTRSHQRGRRG